MPRVRVELQDIVCNDTEDVTGPDEFYVLGAVSAESVTSGVATVPVSVNNGQTVPFAAGGGEVFSADVAPGSMLRIGLVAFDEDSAKDWSRHGEWATQIGTSVGSALGALPFPWLKVAGIIIPYAVSAVGTVMSLDKDDQLGTHAVDEPVAGLQPGPNPRQWSFRGQWGPWQWWSGWNYTVRYTVHLG